jgi:long-chain fatty acid transport protein
VFSNFAEHLEYPADWPGRRAGTFFDLTTTNVNVGLALRPIPRVSVGFGLTVMPASMDQRHVLGTPEALVHSATTAVGFGGNLGVLVVAVPRYLIVGATYRSAIDLDFTGVGDLTASTNAQTATSTLPLPHTFTFGVSSRPVEKLTLSFDAKLALWHDSSSLTVDFQDPAAGAGVVPTRDSLPLNLRDGYGFRLGGELRPITGLWLALGVGYDRTPVRRGWLQPVIPDNDRVLVGVGAGYRWRCFEAGVGYSAQVVLARTSTYPDPPAATYSGVRHVLTLALGVRLERLGPKNLPPPFTGNP